MFEPPVSTPIARMIFTAALRMSWYSLSVSVCAGATVIESPVCTPIGSKFSIEHTMTTLSFVSRMTSSSNSFQPAIDSSIRISLIGEALSPHVTWVRNSSSVCAKLPPMPPRVRDGRRMAGRPSAARTRSASSGGWAGDGGPGALGLLERGGDAAARQVEPDAADGVLEEIAVFRALDGVDLGADQLDLEAGEHAGLGQVEREVEAGLSADGREERIGSLRLDDPRQHLDREGLHVRPVRDLGIRHDRRRIRVRQDDAVALLLQRLARLGAGVVELTGLTDDDRARADEQDGADVGALRHRSQPSASGALTGRAPSSRRSGGRDSARRAAPATPRDDTAPRRW